MSEARPRAKMDVENRAKQFAPFAALVGLDAALMAVEKVVVPKSELSEEMKDELDRRMQKLSCGTMVKVAYYKNTEYVERMGMVAKILPEERILRVVDEKIKFDDIVGLEFEGADEE